MSRPSGGFDADQRRRARHFVWTMVGVIAGFILAALIYGIWHLSWLAVLVAVACSCLRWVAMLLADANPPAIRQRRSMTRWLPGRGGSTRRAR
jgi:Protein of unknown function (DUF3099)